MFQLFRITKSLVEKKNGVKSIKGMSSIAIFLQMLHFLNYSISV